MKESKIFSNQNLTEKVHYVYRVTIDGKYYIGKRTGLLNDLHRGTYTTSSKLIWEKLKNGHHFSIIKILQVFSTAKDALEFESRILTRVDAKTNPKFLNQSNGNGSEFCLKQHTEETKEKMSEITKERFDINTEQGLKNREKQRKSGQAQFDPNTEEGIKNREDMSEIKIEFYKTERGVKNKENHSEFMTERFNPNTERGRKNREHHSEFMKEFYNTETEEGRKRREHMFNKRKEQTKEQLQNRKNASILGDLMFEEDFIKENFLIIDDKNNPRFLWSVYSKLSRYSESSICEQKREGKLKFLHGIKSIKLSEELENAKIKEIEAIIKSRNDEKE